MISRKRFLITLLVLCHLLVWHGIVTSQLRPAQPVPSEEVTIKAQEQEKVGDLYHLRGDVDVHYRDYELKTDRASYNQQTGIVEAEGHLVFEGGPNDLHLTGSHGTYDVKNEKGTFYDVIGTTGTQVRGNHVVLTSSNPFSFTGKVVEKVGRNRIVVHYGRVTSCQLDDPKWTFNSQRADIVLGNEAKLYHSTFRLDRVPFFYFPYATLPVERVGRQSGFLIPAIGDSSRKGFILGDAFYWAINRSMDAEFGAQYWSLRGWAFNGDFRAKPTDHSNVLFRYTQVLDRGYGNPPQKQGGEEAILIADSLFKYGIRGVADIDYLSSYVYRLAFSETFTQAVNSEVKSTAFLSKSIDAYFFNVMGSRYQNYESTTPGDLITIAHEPSLDTGSVEQHIGKSPVTWAYDASLQGLYRSEPGFTTAPLVGRFDVDPRVAIPLQWKGWIFRPELSLRDTYYTQELLPGTGSSVGVAVSEGINRRALGTSVEIDPPAIARIFQKPHFNHKLKHVIEPRITYRYLNGVDNFRQIIRFDNVDILSNTNEVQYGVVNRIYAKSPKDENCTNPDTLVQALSATAKKKQVCVGPREVLRWELTQKYFIDTTFGGALVPGQPNTFTTTEELTGFTFLTNYRHFSPIVSRLRIESEKNTDFEWHLDYDPVRNFVNGSTVLLTHHMADYFFLGGSYAYLNEPPGIQTSTTGTTTGPTVFNQFRWLVGYGSPTKLGPSAAANIGFDINLQYLQYAAVQTAYNWDCCGFSVEYRRFALGSVRNENQYRFALNLTNLGTFGTLRRQERLF
jgi:LPS-assembly protein